MPQTGVSSRGNLPGLFRHAPRRGEAAKRQKGTRPARLRALRVTKNSLHGRAAAEAADARAEWVIEGAYIPNCSRS